MEKTGNETKADFPAPIQEILQERDYTADRWQDIALCYRSLKQNFGGKFGAKNRDFSPDALFEKLGIPKDPEKLRYYILLDELF